MWIVWQNIYNDLMTKSHLIPDFDILSELSLSRIIGIMVSMRKRDVAMESNVSKIIIIIITVFLKQSLAFNMVCLCLRLVALKTEVRELQNKTISSHSPV